MQRIKILTADKERIKVINPSFIEKIKIVEEREWHPDKKFWRLLNKNEILKKFLKIFEDAN